MRSTAHHLLSLAALVAAGTTATSAQAAGSRPIDVTVPLTCHVQSRTDLSIIRDIPMSVRLTGSTDAYAPTGTTVSFSNLRTSIVFPPAAKAVLATFGGDTVGGAFYGLDLLSDGDPFVASVITPNENKLVSIPTTVVSGTTSTEIALTGPDINSSVGPIGVGSEGTVSVFSAGANLLLSSGGVPSDVPISSSAAYDLNCFDNDYSTVVATYPTAPTASSAPVVSTIVGRVLPRLGGIVVVRGDRLAGATAVTVGGTRAPIVQRSAKQLVIVAPPKPRGTYDVVVTTPSGTSVSSPAATVTYGRD